jgi:hypothetical protein
MRRWLAALVIVLSLLLTGCENNNGYYAVVYPYTVTVEEQEFTFLGVRPVSGYTVADANGHEYTYRRFTSDPYRVIEITYPGNIKYIWKQHLEHKEISFGDYSEPFDLSGYTPGPVLVKAIQMPAKVAYVPPQKTPLPKKDFPWIALPMLLLGLITLLAPDWLWTLNAHIGYGRWVMDPTPTERALRWTRIEGVVWIGVALLLFLSYLFS